MCWGTEVKVYSRVGGQEIQIQDNKNERWKQILKYVGSAINKHGGFQKDVRARAKILSFMWVDVEVFLSDRKISEVQNLKVHQTVIWLIIM